MTTGRINQVRTIGGARPARQGAGPNDACLPPPPSPASRQAPSRFVGGHAASAWSRRLRTPGHVSPRLGGARLGPGRGPSCPCGVAPSGARSPAPACAILAWPDRVPASFWFTRSERRRLHASSRGAPLGTATKGVLRLGRRRATRRPQPARFPWDGHPRGKTPPGYAAATAHAPDHVSTRRHTGARIRTPHSWPPARAWLRWRAELATWPPPEALPPCALHADPTRLPHTICSGTTEALLPPKKEERGLLLLPSRFQEGRSVGRAGRRAAPAPGVATGRGTLADGRGGGMHRNR